MSDALENSLCDQMGVPHPDQAAAPGAKEQGDADIAAQANADSGKNLSDIGQGYSNIKSKHAAPANLTNISDLAKATGFGPGAKEQGYAAPAPEMGTDSSKYENNISDEAAQGTISKQKGNPYAAARREREREMREQEIREQERLAAQEQIIQEIGLTNPYTGEIIATIADYQVYKTQYEEDLQKSQITQPDAAQSEQEDIISLVNHHPAVQQAQQLLALQQRQAYINRQRTAADVAASELELIGKVAKQYNLPDINSLADIESQPNFPRFKQLVDRGVGLLEAYKIVNNEAIMRKEVAKKARTQMAKEKSKSHLIPNKGSGSSSDGVVVSEADLNRYRVFNPQISKEEIKKYKKEEQRARSKKK